MTSKAWHHNWSVKPFPHPEAHFTPFPLRWQYFIHHYFIGVQCSHCFSHCKRNWQNILAVWLSPSDHFDPCINKQRYSSNIYSHATFCVTSLPKVEELNQSSNKSIKGKSPLYLGEHQWRWLARIIELDLYPLPLSSSPSFFLQQETTDISILVSNQVWKEWLGTAVFGWKKEELISLSEQTLNRLNVVSGPSRVRSSMTSKNEGCPLNIW